jgi:hypothetical protein
MKVVNVHGCVKILFFSFFCAPSGTEEKKAKLKTHRSGFDPASSTPVVRAGMEGEE